ncbi:MAG: response regulator [Clostridiales Family XIII bacterium]|nr:response regulator [Clostridiales Family XIII bacterium]
MKKILIIDDSFFFRGQLRLVLSAEYEVVDASSGEDGIDMVKAEKPDLVLLDGVLSGMDGFDVCRTLRDSESNNLMPIIMITSMDGREDILKALELGADDYIVKPFDNRELFSRIRNLLKRIDRNRNANPLTGLSGNIEIQREFASRLSRGLKFAVGYVDLDNFKAYNDAYGFSRGDTAIVMTADILKDQAAMWGNDDDFVGHIGGDDFIIVSTPDRIERICSEAIAAFDERVLELYNERDRRNGYIKTVNRRDDIEIFPLMTVSIAVVTNQYRELKGHVDIGDIASEIKKKLKAMPGSNYFVDRRTEHPDRAAAPDYRAAAEKPQPKQRTEAKDACDA